ncbi:hypothetical protein FQN54_002827 [Arachnomyces sp. PD_36]|nr:hypothetical protein FQN54_002827 [Arachnomyces sp. PD_36]
MKLFDCPTRVDGKCTSWLNTPVHETVTVDGATETRRISVVYATNIQIRYQASDSSVVPVPTETNLPPIGGWPLSTGQKAGIAIAVIVGVFGIAGAVYYVIRKNKARRAYSDIHLQPNVDPSDPPPAYPGKQ